MFDAQTQQPQSSNGPGNHDGGGVFVSVVRGKKIMRIHAKQEMNI
jgi:hypothetical protein